jgi:putative transposase
MVDKAHPKLSVRKQCKLLKINRSSLYRKHKVTIIESRLIAELNKIYHKYPFYGYRKIKVALAKEGINAGKKKILKTKKYLNLATIYPKKNLSQPNPKEAKYPYLLDSLEINKINQVWQTDITYLKINGKFMYLSAIIDVCSRKVLTWKFSNTMHADFCVATLQEAVATYGKPEILNTDQGSQYTCEKFINELAGKGIKISMVSKGRATDNIYIERFWRSLKYEEVYLKEYANVKELKNSIEEYFRFYNEERFHQSLDYKTPDQYFYSYSNFKKNIA